MRVVLFLAPPEGSKDTVGHYARLLQLLAKLGRARRIPELARTLAWSAETPIVEITVRAMSEDAS